MVKDGRRRESTGEWREVVRGREDKIEGFFVRANVDLDGRRGESTGGVSVNAAKEDELGESEKDAEE